MAVVSGRSNLVRDPMQATAAADTHQMTGKLVLMTGVLACLATDSNTSKYKLAELPGDAIVHESTFFDVEAWGFAQVVIGTETDTDALVDQTRATETIVTPFAIGDAFHGKRWWEVLGLAANPRGKIALWVHAEADATGAGSMPFRLAYVDPGF